MHHPVNLLSDSLRNFAEIDDICVLVFRLMSLLVSFKKVIDSHLFKRTCVVFSLAHQQSSSRVIVLFLHPIGKSSFEKPLPAMSI